MIWKIGKLVIAIGATWYFTWLYFRKQLKQEKARKDQLLSEFRTMIQEEDARAMSLDELEGVILERGFPTEFGIVPAECPDCGSETDLKGRSRYGPTGDHHVSMTAYCTAPDCGWNRGM